MTGLDIGKTKRKMLLYLHPPLVDLFCGAVLATPLTIALMALMPRIPRSVFLVSLLFDVAAFSYGWRFIGRYVKIFRCMRAYEREGMLAELCRDFEDGTRIDDDSVRVGKRFLFSKRSFRILEYSDICLLFFQRVLLRSGAESERLIVAVMDNDERCVIGRAEELDESDAAMSVISAAVISAVGYKWMDRGLEGYVEAPYVVKDISIFASDRADYLNLA